MAEILYADFETKSECDLPKSGSHRYAEDPSTDLLCLGFAFDEEDAEIWTPDDVLGDDRVCEHVAKGGLVVGHNIGGFEIPIWNRVAIRYGYPPLLVGQCADTMAMAYAMALPASLAHAAPAAGMTIEKDVAGGRVMMQLSQPRDVKDGVTTWWEKRDVPDKFERLYEYCKQDVIVERALFKRLLKLSPSEKRLWDLDHVINQRGVRVDVKAVEAAIGIVEAEKERLNREIQAASGGQVESCAAVAQIKAWITDQGIALDGVAKADVIALLSRSDLPRAVRCVLELRQTAAKSSTAKLEAMLLGVCDDGRLRGMFQYHGAQATGRWAGRRVQLQNLPRPKLSYADVESVFEILEAV